jgi:hypothetical protein
MVTFAAYPNGDALRRAVRHQGYEMSKDRAIEQRSDIIGKCWSHESGPGLKMSKSTTSIDERIAIPHPPIPQSVPLGSRGTSPRRGRFGVVSHDAGCGTATVSVLADT